MIFMCPLTSSTVRSLAAVITLEFPYKILKHVEMEVLDNKEASMQQSR